MRPEQPSRVFVKICGVTRPEDAAAARQAGADAIGINFWPGSKRYVASLGQAREIAQAAPELQSVGVFVNAPPKDVERALEVVDLVQFHGDESPAYVAPFSGRYVRAIAVRDEDSLGELALFACPWYLLDAPVVAYGGQGQTFDWSLACSAQARYPIVLAGGLGPENVAAAVEAVRPFGVDVASGVESEPGIKDARKMEQFVKQARTR